MDPKQTHPRHEDPADRPRTWRGRALSRLGLALALLGGVTLIGATAAASRGGDDGGFARLFGHHRHHGGPLDAERAREHADWAVSFVLHRIDASDEQESRVNEIVDRAIGEAFEALGPHRAQRRLLHELLAAPEIDREALEALRTRHIEVWDRLSRTLTESLVELGEVLTPEQRAELIEMAESHRGGRRGHWH